MIKGNKSSKKVYEALGELTKVVRDCFREKGFFVDAEEFIFDYGHFTICLELTKVAFTPPLTGIGEEIQRKLRCKRVMVIPPVVGEKRIEVEIPHSFSIEEVEDLDNIEFSNWRI